MEVRRIEKDKTLKFELRNTRVYAVPAGSRGNGKTSQQQG